MAWGTSEKDERDLTKKILTPGICSQPGTFPEPAAKPADQKGEAANPDEVLKLLNALDF